MADEGSGWLGGLRWAWANRAEIVDAVKRVRDWFRSAPGRDILIIGPGGVGKTTLAAILSGKFDWLLSDPWDYQESYGVEYETLKDDPKVGIVIPPGQHVRREATWAATERDLATGRYRGVIVVSANGRHAIAGRSYKAHPLYQNNKDEFLPAYFASCRDHELGVLDRVTASLRTAPGKVWLLSVVAKEDLWWPGRDVDGFYASGRYAESVARLVAAKGAEHVRHELIRVSLLICNLVTESDTLAKNVEGYDHRMQVTGVRRLFEVVDALRDWEAAT